MQPRRMYRRYKYFHPNTHSKLGLILSSASSNKTDRIEEVQWEIGERSMKSTCVCAFVAESGRARCGVSGRVIR